MNITLRIPDSITRSLRIPEAEAEQRLRQELAVALYAQGLLSFGKASELAGEDRFRFASVLTQRGIARHYGHEELTQNLQDGSGEEYPADIQLCLCSSSQPSSCTGLLIVES